MIINFPYSSFLAASGGSGYYSTDGLDQNLNTGLAAFRLHVSSRWQLYYVAWWDNYWVVNNTWQFRGTSAPNIQSLGTYWSSRVWAGGYTSANNPWSYSHQPRGTPPMCNMFWSNVPVPVIEAQAALTR
jgi:hypothetical protein